MVDRIMLEAKSDRELLLLTAEAVNNLEERLIATVEEEKKHEEEIHGKEGINKRLDDTEGKQKTNRMLIYALWAVLLAMGGVIGTIFTGHLVNITDLFTNMKRFSGL